MAPSEDSRAAPCKQAADRAIFSQDVHLPGDLFFGLLFTKIRVKALIL